MNMNKAIKKVTAVALAGVLTAAVFAGCSKDSSQGGEKYKIGICQLQQHDALDAATEGFKRGVTEVLGADNVEFDLQNAAGESATCATITNQFVADGVDLIMANATGALQAAMASTTTIPIVATSITDYATALQISDWSGTTGINVTGTSDLAPLAEQAAMVKELCPDAKTVGIIYCSAEANSKYQSDVVSAELEKLGFETNVYTCADSNEIATVTQQACDESDAIYIPTDNTIASSAPTVNEIAEPAGVPIITGEEGICKGCGIATLSISYDSIGYEAGKMAAEILKDGKNPAEMPIQYATELTKKYMPERAEALGITIPEGYTAIDTNA